MSDGFEKLKGIGAQKIHEKTHITKHHVQSMLHETFDDMTKVQVLGFISILERDYDVDLSELKTKAKDFYGVEPEEITEKEKVFITPKKKKSYTLFYVIVVVIIFAAGVLYNIDLQQKTTSTAQDTPIDNSVIEDAKDNISNNNTIIEENKVLVVENNESNSTNEDNTTLLEEENEVLAPTAEVEQDKPDSLAKKESFKIISKTKLWIGYIDLSDYKRYQKIFTGELDMDPTKDWLMTLGHGYMKVEIDGVVTEFKDEKHIRLLYKDGNISEITLQEFKDLNKGNKW